MNTSKITRWAALLAFMGGMAAGGVAHAQITRKDGTLSITNGSLAETTKVYNSTHGNGNYVLGSGWAALSLNNGIYQGNKIQANTKVSTLELNHGTGYMAVVVSNNSKLILGNSGISAGAYGTEGIYGLQNAVIELTKTNIYATGQQSTGITLNNSSAVLDGSAISVTGKGAIGITINKSTVTLNNTTITVDSKAADAIALHAIDIPNNNSTYILNNSTIIGDVTQGAQAILSLIMEVNSKGTGGWTGGSLTLKDAKSSWTFTKNSQLDSINNKGTLTIGDYQVTVANAEHTGKMSINVNSDTGKHGSINVTGRATGNGTIILNITGKGKFDQNTALKDVKVGTGTENWQFAAFDWGLNQIGGGNNNNGDGGFYLTPTGNLSTAGNIATGLLAAQKGAWFAQQNSLLKRMGDLRLDEFSKPAAAGSKTSSKDKKLSAPGLLPSADHFLDNVWVRAYGQQLDYDASATGHAFTQYVYGLDIGTDYKWKLDNRNSLFTGVFLGYGRADTDHRHFSSTSEINNYYAGLYASWLHQDGWYADATLKLQYADHDLTGHTNGVDYFGGSYSNWGVGGSLEFGKRFSLKDGWFVEPQLQANYMHLLAEDYTLSHGLNVSTGDLDAFQLRVGVVGGKTFKLKNGGALQPYVKLSGVELVSSGGELRAAGNSVRPNLDGTRVELGGGVIWQLNAHNQLHFDYEASFGDKYEKPWGLTAGYRYQF